MNVGAWAADVSKAVADGPPEDGLTIVTGNEASDADSIVTATMFAYLRQHQHDNEGESARKKRRIDVIPYVACNREDVSLRGETVELLGLCGVNPDHLTYGDDPAISKMLAKVKGIVLTDHNKAVGPFVAHEEKVIEIHDHHKDLQSHPQVTGDKRIIAFEGEKATAGSACSVVAERYLETPMGQQLLARDNGAVARALLGVILVDTSNLDPAAKKVTPRDLAAAKALEELAPTPPRDELFKRLDAAKFNAELWKTLSIDQCCRYDYKCFKAEGGHTVGLSSVLCDLSIVAQKDGFRDVVGKWAEKSTIYGILSNVKDKSGLRRQLLVMSGGDATLGEKAAAFAQAYTTPGLQLEPLDIPNCEGYRVFEQKNLGASRKQIGPCFQDFFKAQ